MSTDKERLEHLEESYRKLWEQQLALKEAIKQNYAEFKEIRERLGIPAVEARPELREEQPKIVAEKQAVNEQPAAVKSASSVASAPPKQAQKSTWEQYIGEQLLSKIGIVILVIGVGIGAKYAIDHQMMSPAMRIGGGYLIAALLGFFAYRFKEKYTAFSAILVSGAMAVTYFMTFSAHVFYHLYPYWLTFVLLLLTTVATVVSALRYNQVIIAHFGLIGAYVLPILIAAKASHISNYFAYMALINCGILVISFLRDWKSLYHVAFGWTAVVFVTWFFTTYSTTADSGVALAYLCFFFALFHTATLAYPLVKKHTFTGDDLFLVVPNLTSFFVMGQYVLHYGTFGIHADLIFGIVLTALFFALWAVFRNVRPDDRLLQETHFVMAVAALTMTLIFEWSGANLAFGLMVEAAILAWLALRSKWLFLDVVSSVVLCTAACFFFVSLNFDHWYVARHLAGSHRFLLFTSGFAVLSVAYVIFRKQFDLALLNTYFVPKLIVIVALSGFYLTIIQQMSLTFEQLYMNKHVFEEALANPQPGASVMLSSQIALQMCLFGFSLVYWLCVVALDRFYLGFEATKKWMPVASMVIVLAGLLGITVISEAANTHLQSGNGFLSMYLLARYAGIVSILLLGWLLLHGQSKTPWITTLLHITILWILSLEMIQWLNFSGNKNAYKLSLSILWGLYAVYIMFLGVRNAIGPLRVTAMIILGVTFVKLFFLDIAGLSTISKTIVFIALGGLLLVGAYFYQRYKTQEEPESKNETE